MIAWIVLRAAGIGAYVTLFLTVVWGLVATTSVLGKRVSKASATSVHQFLATCGLFLLAIHVGGILLDSFVRFSPLDVLVPLHGTFRPVAVSFGIVAMYAMVVVLASSWARKPIGTTWWRRLHLLAVPAFTLALAHGVFAGTDSPRPWMFWTYIGTGLIALFLVIVRGLTVGFRPERAAAVSRAGSSVA